MAQVPMKAAGGDVEAEDDEHIQANKHTDGSLSPRPQHAAVAPADGLVCLHAGATGSSRRQQHTCLHLWDLSGRLVVLTAPLH